MNAPTPRPLHRLLALCALVALAACATGGGERHGEAFPQRYRLPMPDTGAQTASPMYPAVLRVAAPSAPAWLNTPHMYYQLAYDKTGRIAAYSESRWVEPPPAMLAQALQHRLSDSGLLRAVTGDAGGGSPTLRLQVDLNDFEQRFSGPDQSAGVLAARATLFQTGDDRVLAQRDFRYAVTAPSADAKGGVQALGRAASRFTEAVAGWIRDTLGACAPGCITPAQASR